MILKFSKAELLFDPMEGDTFRSRLLTLLQRSRQAHRLYSSMERMQRGDAAEFTEMQASAWRLVNGELIKQLTTLLDAPVARQLSSQVLMLKDRFLGDFRAAEAELHQRQRELIAAAEKGDFVRSAVVSRSLVGLKARAQAAHAAFVELEGLTTDRAATDRALDRGTGAVPASAGQQPGAVRASSVKDGSLGAQLELSSEDGRSADTSRSESNNNSEELRGADLVQHAAMIASLRSAVGGGGASGARGRSGVGTRASGAKTVSSNAVGARSAGSGTGAKIIPLRKRS